jgi:hypothetical protein
MSDNRQNAEWLVELFQRNDAAISQVAQSVRATWGAAHNERQSSHTGHAKDLSGMRSGR